MNDKVKQAIAREIIKLDTQVRERKDELFKIHNNLKNAELAYEKARDEANRCRIELNKVSDEAECKNNEVVSLEEELFETARPFRALGIDEVIESKTHYVVTHGGIIHVLAR